MSTRFGAANGVQNRQGPGPSRVDRLKDACSVVETVISHLLPEAAKRGVRRAVFGGRFCAVMLDDGGVGVANICPDVCGVPGQRVTSLIPPRATPAAEALAALAPPTRSPFGLATANALANRFPDPHISPGEMGLDRDLLEVLELQPDDHVGMVGCFNPLVDPIRRRVRRLSIFERARRLAPGLLDANQAFELLPECSVALITATTLINGTIDTLLGAAATCREVVLLGPSTPLLPEVFARSPGRVTLLAGVVVSNAEELLGKVARDGGTRDFRGSVAKVNVRVRAIDRASGAA